jgi:hypothetical protein
MKNLPEKYRFKEDYLKYYRPGMKLPKIAYSKGKIFTKKEYPLPEFINFYFNIIDPEIELKFDAHKEKGYHEAVRDLPNLFSSSDDIKNEIEGSINTFKEYVNEIEKAFNYITKNRLPKDKWPFKYLEEILKNNKEELKRIESESKSTYIGI